MDYKEEGLEVDLIKDPDTGEYVQFEWRDAVGYRGYYQVSNYGHVKSIDRTIVTKAGYEVFYVGRLLKLRVDKIGYIRVKLSVNRNSKLVLVHRLVAEAFIPNPEVKRYVNHINSVRIDNFINNLSWVTHAENMIHAGKFGNCLRGGDNPHSKTIVNCRGEKFRSITEAAKAYNLKSITSISNVLSGYKESAGKYSDRSPVKWKETGE